MVGIITVKTMSNLQLRLAALLLTTLTFTWMLREFNNHEDFLQPVLREQENLVFPTSKSLRLQLNSTQLYVKFVPQPVEPSINPQLVNPPLILSTKVIDDIKKLIIFVGSGRSGHSIVGSLMDAHPHVIIPHEFHIFRNFPQFHLSHIQNWNKSLINSLYQKSVADANGIRNITNKGYSLKVNDMWQGKFDQYIEVIGDKSGGSTSQVYMDNKTMFHNRLKILKKSFSIPILGIHVIRNPFDQIATRSLYGEHNSNISATLKLKRQLLNSPNLKFRNSNTAYKATLHQFRYYDATMEIIGLLGRENVLDVHIIDLIHNPKAALGNIFEFLEVDASEHYLQVCADKVFKSTSQTRELIFWPPPLKYLVEEKIKSYGFLSRYNFTSD